MFLREDLDTELGGLTTMLRSRDDDAVGDRVSPDQFVFHMDAADPAIEIKGKGNKKALTIPANEQTMTQIASFLNIPTSFNKRLQELTQGATQNAFYADVLGNTVQKDMEVKVFGDAIARLDEWGRQTVRPHQIAEVAEKVFDRSGVKIARLLDEPHEFGFDAFVPVDGTGGHGGDRAVGDLTAGGLRFGVNLKQGLAPWVQPFMYRLICTNGMETSRADLKVDARGQTIEQVMLEIESMARLAFSGIENEINHFYEMRNQRVENPERAIRAIARERGIPDRSFTAIVDLAAGEDMPDEPTMFDVVNLVTNFANSPAVRNDGGRLLLERAGGAVVTDNRAKCGHCQQAVVH